MIKKEYVIIAILIVVILASAYFLLRNRRPNERNDNTAIKTKDITENIKSLDDEGQMKAAEQGRDLLNSGDYEQAEKIFSQLASAHKDNDNYQTEWALALYNLGKYEEAEKIYRTIIAREEQAFAYNGLANVLRDRGIYEAKQIEDEVDSERIKMEFWQEAEQNYQSAIDIDSKFSVSYNNFAQLLADQGKKAEAIKILEQGISANPDSEELKEALNIMKEINQGNNER